jgi:SAM-dependent methyltransferase
MPSRLAPGESGSDPVQSEKELERLQVPLSFFPPPGYSEPAVWTGRGFRVGQTHLPILSYQTGPAGWTEELTRIHEDVAGEDHYIDRASRQHAARQLQRWVRRPRPLVMDVGCSSGFFLRLLRARFPGYQLVGADCVRGPLENLAASMPDVPLLQFDLCQCPLPDQTFDALVMLNVLEHIEDDLGAARQAQRILKPGGLAVIEVPAGPDLYDIYDRQLLHFRRYRMVELIRMLQSAGFEIVERSHLGFFLYPAFRIVKKRNQKHLAAVSEVQRALVKRDISRSSNSVFMHGIMRLESAIRRWIYYPVGIRCLATCRKPEQYNTRRGKQCPNPSTSA